MLLKRLGLMIFVCSMAIGRPALGAEPTSVALTMTRPAEATNDVELAASLLELVEVAIQADKSLAVVERRDIDLVIQELVLSQSRPDNSQLQLGRLITADFLAMLELLPPDKDSPDSSKPFVRLRVVDPKTAAIRGVTVARLDEDTVEETADQFARYVPALIRAPEKPTVTVAVTPFESKGRFDRLRPLELGIRDLVTARMLQLSGAAPPGPADPEKQQAPAELLRFQVLQRSNMEQLLRELDLIQSGFSDKSRLPAELPPRGAAYLVRGQIDERQTEDTYTVIVRGEMLQAATMRVVDQFDIEVPPQDLAKQLVAAIDRFGERLLKEENIGPARHRAPTFEVQSFKQQTLADVVRFRRKDPRTGWWMAFHFPNQPAYWAPRAVDLRSLLGRHLLHKSIDHLESVLFMNPDDAEAAYALGFCYSINEPDFYRPDRADELLRKAYLLSPQTVLGGLALEYLTHIDFDDRDGQLIDGHEAEAIERTWFAFENTPRVWQNHAWKFLKLLGKLHRRPDQSQALADLIAEAAPIVERSPQNDHEGLGVKVHDLAVQLVRQARDQPELKEKGIALLKRWADGDDKELAYWGHMGLTTLAADNHDFIASAAAYEASAAMLVDLKLPRDRDRHDGLLIDAAKMYRLGGDPARALKLLESFEVRLPKEKDKKSTGNLLGLRLYEIGRCQEMLGHREKALAEFLQATKINPSVGDRTDIVRRIERLGGVPLDKGRDVDVRYFPLPGGDRQEFVSDIRAATGGHQGPQSRFARAAGYFFNLHLASDGHNLYVGDEQGVRVFNVGSQAWDPAPIFALPVTCIKGRDGLIFVGTKSDGLWQFDVSAGNWQRTCPLDKLPDPHVESLALDGHDIYLGVGTNASGGLVKIDSDGNVHVFNEPNAPAVAPTQIVIAKNQIFVRTLEAVYQWSAITEAWLKKDSGAQAKHRLSPQLFAGNSTIWMSQQGRELARWQATDQENAQFRAAWYIPANNADFVVQHHQDGYSVLFVAQRGDEVWFGGEPWAPFVSSGLYRFNLKTKDFHKFSPADGFRALDRHFVYDGLWLDDQLWLATSEGLCAVKPIGPASVAIDGKPVE